MEVTYIGALVAGLISFLSPCVLPLVPPYICYLGGTTMEQLAGDEEMTPAMYWRVVMTSVLFVLGFTTVFVSLGATATVLGQLVAENLQELAYVAGVVIIVLGLHFLGILKIPLFYREARFHAETRPASMIGAYIIGLAFAFGWTPCVGPVLATILIIAGSQDSLLQGTTLLTSYALGIGLPFLLAALFARPFMTFMQRFRRYLGRVEMTLGALLVVTGVLFITGSMNEIGFWLLETFPALGRVG